MGRFVARRLIGMVVVLFAISVLTFLIFNVIPNGDPAQRLAGRNASHSQVDAVRRQWGFDHSVFVQYGKTMGNIFSGDLVSYSRHQDVLHEIWVALPHTLSLAIGAAIIWIAFSIALGVYSAMRVGRFSDRLLTVLALAGISMPVFWVGALMNYYLGFKAGLFPNGGYVDLTADPVQWAYHLIMPWTALSLLFIGIYSRVVRSSILDTINE